MLEPDGYQIVKTAVALALCERASQMIDQIQLDTAGSRRMLDHRWCAELAMRLKQHPQIKRLLTDQAVAVQCTLFEKSEQKNWLVALHRDVSVCVAKRVSAKGWGGWSEKEGLTIAQPPRTILEGLIAVRLHLDDCPICAGTLRVVAQSHQQDWGGNARLQESDTIALAAHCGDALLLRPLLLHASSKASVPSRRRVLHFLFAPDRLADVGTADLRWRWTI